MKNEIQQVQNVIMMYQTQSFPTPTNLRKKFQHKEKKRNEIIKRSRRRENLTM